MTSNREKKRIVQAGIRDLLSRPGWDPRKFESGMTSGGSAPEEAIRSAAQGEVYRDSGECADCLAVRKASDDETALCEHHMKKALGL